MDLIAAAFVSAREFAIATNIENNKRGVENGWTFWTTLPEDEAYWAEQALVGVMTGADVIRRDLIQTYSDTYKGRYGTRPSLENFDQLSTETIEDILEELQDPNGYDDAEVDWDSFLDEGDEGEEGEVDLDDSYHHVPAHVARKWGLK